MLTQYLFAQELPTGTWNMKCLEEPTEMGTVKVNGLCANPSNGDVRDNKPQQQMIWQPDKILLVTGKDSSAIYYNWMPMRNEITLSVEGVPTVYKIFYIESGRIIMRNEEDKTLLYLIEQKKK